METIKCVLRFPYRPIAIAPSWVCSTKRLMFPKWQCIHPSVIAHYSGTEHGMQFRDGHEVHLESRLIKIWTRFIRAIVIVLKRDLMGGIIRWWSPCSIFVNKRNKRFVPFTDGDKASPFNCSSFVWKTVTTLTLRRVSDCMAVVHACLMEPPNYGYWILILERVIICLFLSNLVLNCLP